MLRPPPAPHAVMAGSIIPAVLITGINSELPGPIVAQVREHVYDTATGRYLLIPQGARLIGVYDSAVAFGQERVLIAWNRLIFPDTRSLMLGQMTGADLAGLSGLKDKVNNHWPRLIGAVILSSLMSTGTIASQGDIEGWQPNLAQELTRAVGENINRAGQRIIQRELNVQPTLEVRPGWRLNVMVNQDLILPPYAP